MRIKDWIRPDAESLLDVGCNVGVWLADCRRYYPKARLAGIKINAGALAVAQANLT